MNFTQHYFKVNVSKAIQRDSENLIVKMRNNNMDINVLPKPYRGSVRELGSDDAISFSEFLLSRRGDLIIKASAEDIEAGT